MFRGNLQGKNYQFVLLISRSSCDVRAACTITVVEKRNLRSFAQQRKNFWPANCRVFGVLLKDYPSVEPRRRGI
jgi:hypothetical protein